VKEDRALKEDILKSILETDEGEVSRILKEARLEGEAAGVLEAAAKLLKAYRDELPEDALKILAKACGLPESETVVEKNDPKNEGEVTEGPAGIYGASVTAGNALRPDAAGKLAPATGSDAIVAITAESGSANEIRSVYIVSRATSGAIQKSILAIPIKLAKVANGDVLTNFTPGFPGRIVSAAFDVTDPVTTASKAATPNLEIGTVNLTGGAMFSNLFSTSPKLSPQVPNHDPGYSSAALPAP
jgi:hypothetical protein